MSRATPAPNNEVKTISLAKPRIREMKVQKLTIPELASNFIELDLLFESIFSDNPAMQEQMGGMNKQMESMFVEYPEEALKIGDSFDVQLDNEGMSIAAVYTLTGVTVTEYILSVNGDISSSDELPVTGTMKGTFNLFRECGMVMSGDLTMEMEALGENITIKMLMESTKS